jgi:hypothetical protein
VPASAEFVALSSGGVRDRFDRLTSHLDHWGDVIARDIGAATGRRLLEFQLLAPGGVLSTEVEALFREYYQRNRAGGWDILKYTYEYLDLVRSWRLAFHLHPLGGRSKVAHAHCGPGAVHWAGEPSVHLRAIEYELREANAEFMRLYASGRPPECSAFLPMSVNRMGMTTPFGPTVIIRTGPTPDRCD